MEVADECSASQEGGVDAINRVGAALNRAEDFRVHDD